MSELLRTSRFLRYLPLGSGAVAVYHGLYGRLSRLGPAAHGSLRRFDQPAPAASGPMPLVQECQASGFLVDAEADELAVLEIRRARRRDAAARGAAVRAIQLVVANACNFRCAYCFEGYGGTPLAETQYAHAPPARVQAQTSRTNVRMEPSAAERYLRSAVEQVRGAGTGALAVQFFGGEPLLNWPAVKHVLTTIGPICEGVAVSYSIVTNGSLVTDEIAECLAQADVTAIVSYDSPRSDARLFRSGLPSHDRVCAGLERLRRHGTKVALNAAITGATLTNVGEEIIDFALDHGIGEVGVILDFDPRFYSGHHPAEIVERVLAIWSCGRARGVVVTGYWHQIFEAIVDDDRYEARGFQNCSAMGAQLSIEPSGEVFACKASGAHFGHITDLPALLRSTTYQAYAMRACTTPAACAGCELEHFCGGLCLGAIENAHGGIYAVEAGACEVYRTLTRRLVRATVEPLGQGRPVSSGAASIPDRRFSPIPLP